MGEPWPEPAAGEWQVLDADGNVVDHGPVPVMQAAASAGDDQDGDGDVRD